MLEDVFHVGLESVFVDSKAQGTCPHLWGAKYKDTSRCPDSSLHLEAEEQLTAP